MTGKDLILNTIHGIFLGFVISISLAILLFELYPNVDTYIRPIFLIPILTSLGAFIGFVKGYTHQLISLNFLFSTAGTMLTPLTFSAIIIYLMGVDSLILLPPVYFREGIGLPQLDNQASTYLFSIVFTITFIAAMVSSLSINKKKRWSYK